jgi:hypothetical protein
LVIGYLYVAYRKLLNSGRLLVVFIVLGCRGTNTLAYLFKKIMALSGSTGPQRQIAEDDDDELST